MGYYYTNTGMQIYISTASAEFNCPAITLGLYVYYVKTFNLMHIHVVYSIVIHFFHSFNLSWQLFDNTSSKQVKVYMHE